jgi:peptidoglycan hydrolase CwlO-like protein
MNHVEQLENKVQDLRDKLDQMACLYQLSQNEIRDQREIIKNQEKKIKSLSFKLN